MDTSQKLPPLIPVLAKEIKELPIKNNIEISPIANDLKAATQILLQNFKCICVALLSGALYHPMIDNIQKDWCCLIFSAIFFTSGESNIKFLTSDLANATWKICFMIKLIIMCSAWKIKYLKIILSQQE